MHPRWSALLGAVAVLLPTPRVRPPDAASLAARFAGMTAVTGYEQAMADSLRALLPKAVRDRAGNVVVRLGRGTPIRLAACPLDEAGYIVGGLHDGGYLTVRRVGRPAATLQDQWLMGRRVAVWRTDGPLPGVVSIPSVHLLRGRGRALQGPAYSVDQLRVDVGAASEAQLDTLGLAIGDPVAAEKDPVRYGDSLLAAPAAGIRGACAALASAVLRGAAPRTGTVVAVFAVESRLGGRGIRTAAAESGPFAASLLLNFAVPARVRGDAYGTVTHRDLTVRYAGSPVETINLHEVASLADGVARWIRGGR